MPESYSTCRQCRNTTVAISNKKVWLIIFGHAVVEVMWQWLVYACSCQYVML